MGSPADEPWRSDDEMQHEAAVSDFYLSPTEVSQLEYNTLMGSNGAADGVPITSVTWHDAIFCSNGGGGLGQSVTAISKLAPTAHVSQGLSIYYTGGADMPQQVANWIAG